MNQNLWTTVERYLVDTLVKPDPVLDAAREASEAAGLPPIAVAPHEGKLLHLLAKLVGARSILEIGTLGGYSTIWLGKALPEGGRLVTLEADPKHAEVARGNLEKAGLSGVTEVKVGDALEILPTLDGPFDLTFVDADKVHNPEYFQWALEYSRPGSVIVVDNVIRSGEVADPGSTNPAVQGVRRMHDLIASEPRVDATALQTVGHKGYDGLTIILVS